VASRVDQAVSQALQDGTLRKRMNDAGSNPDHIGQTVFVERIRGDIACYDALLIVSQIVRVVPGAASH
jgi:hypothetical protein